MRANSHIWTTVRLCTSEQSPLCSVFCLRLQNNPSSLTALLRCPAPAAVDKLALPLVDRCASSQYPALRALGRAAPFPQKVTLGSPARLQTPAATASPSLPTFCGFESVSKLFTGIFSYIYIFRGICRSRCFCPLLYPRPNRGRLFGRPAVRLRGPCLRCNRRCGSYPGHVL